MIIGLLQELILSLLYSSLLLNPTGLSADVGHKITPDAAVDVPRPLPAIDASLNKTLQQIAETYRVPMVVELANPLPRAKLPSATITAREALNAIVKRYPQYDWKLQDSVIHFYDQTLKGERGNFLNWRLKSFTISGTIADVDLRLKSEINKVRKGITSEGGLFVGILPADLEKGPLPTVVLKDVTAREVLFKLGDIAPRFFTAVIFPRSGSLTPADIDEAFANWQWSGIRSER